MEAIRSSETSVNTISTRLQIPEDCFLHRRNLFTDLLCTFTFFPEKNGICAVNKLLLKFCNLRLPMVAQLIAFHLVHGVGSASSSIINLLHSAGETGWCPGRSCTRSNQLQTRIHLINCSHEISNFTFLCYDCSI